MKMNINNNGIDFVQVATKTMGVAKSLFHHKNV